MSKTTKNKILTDLKEICKIWEEYIRELFDDVRSEIPSGIFSNAFGSPIIESEVVYAHSEFKNEKALEKDNIYAEMLRLVNI